MRLTKALIIVALSVFVKANAQNSEKSNAICQNILLEGNESYNLRNFPRAASFYIKALNECQSFDKPTYEKLIVSLKNCISKQANEFIKEAYIDTIIIVYQAGETKGLYDENNDFAYATYLLKAKTPNPKEADRLFLRGLNKSSYFSGENFLNLYYLNLYTLYKSADSIQRSNYKLRLLLEYFRISDWIVKGKMSDQLKSNVFLYFNDVFKLCDDFGITMNSYFFASDSNETRYYQDLKNFKEILEIKSCTNSKIYERIIDSLLLEESSTELYLIKSQILRNRGEFSKEFSTLYFARKFSNNEDQQSEIDFLSAKSLFNVGNYSESHRSAIAIKGKWKSEAFVLAAESVVALAKNCGKNDTEHQLNYYYALNLLEISKKTDTVTLDLIQKYKSELPTQVELTTAGFKIGEYVSLPCWNLLIKIL